MVTKYNLDLNNMQFKCKSLCGIQLFLNINQIYLYLIYLIMQYKYISYVQKKNKKVQTNFGIYDSMSYYIAIFDMIYSVSNCLD